MKELSTEEKAKAYDEALKVLHKYDGANIMFTQDLKEEMFPELKESEDEKIRKSLIDWFSDKHAADDFRGIAWERIVAWLEKQGEQNLIMAKSPQLGEHKPANKVEPKFKVKYADSEYNVLEVKDIAGVTFYGIEDEPNHIDYVKADNCEIISGGYGIKENGSLYPTKPAVFSEQKPAWSEEDEMFVHGLIRGLAAKRDIHGHTTFSSDCIDITKTINWLKSLKDRVQPKQEWSEEDETVLNNLIYALANDRIGNDRDEYISYLKSLKDRNTWKPSDEQMDALLKLEEMHVLEHEKNQENAHLYMVVKSIREQLLKLREE